MWHAPLTVNYVGWHPRYAMVVRAHCDWSVWFHARPSIHRLTGVLYIQLRATVRRALISSMTLNFDPNVQVVPNSKTRSLFSRVVIRFLKRSASRAALCQTTSGARPRRLLILFKVPSVSVLLCFLRLWLTLCYSMSGKSTYLRQIALITVMAMCGSFVPAESANIR